MRDPNCTLCKLHKEADVVCQWGFGSKKADVVVVSRMPNSGNYQTMIENELIEAGLDLSRVYFTAANKCRNFDDTANNNDIKACRVYLNEELAEVKPKWILCFGNEALYSVTGHSGIMKWRGKIIETGAAKIFGTVSPASVVRNPGQKGTWTADIQFFVSQVLGRPNDIVRPKMAKIDNKDKLKALKQLLTITNSLSYDIETTGDSEFAKDAAIVSLAGTSITNADGVDKQITWTLPLYHPESPFKLSWVKVLKYLSKPLEQTPIQIAHNGKYDARWMRQFGVRSTVTFDTIIAAHLLDENRVKGLKPLGRILLGVQDWGISTKDLLSTPLKTVLKYNGLDTYYTYELYKVFKQQLIEQPRLLRLFKLLMMPGQQELIDTERRGIWLDSEKLASAIEISFQMRDQIDRELMTYVPDPETPDLNWPTNSKGKVVDVNFNPSKFSKWFLFDLRNLPILERGKKKADGSPGDPSMREGVMLELKSTGDPVVKLLLDRAKWQKYCSTYVTQYDTLRDENDRIHTTFKLTGTVTGRLSSGKADEEKVTARKPIRGVNLQQVPRDPFIRGLFGAPPGYTFVEADFSQVELRLVAFVAREKTMMGIYHRGEDIHTATASWVLSIPMSKVSKDDRKKAKAVNFGFIYGMGAKKFVETAFEKYELVFSLDEAKQIRKVFFERFPGLPSWHARQRRIVHEYGRVQSPMGRVRHLPDIYSADQSVQGEAERQAINSPIQAFASDMNLLSMILINQKFRERQLEAYCLGLVHDALNFEIRDDHLAEALPIIVNTMENLPLKKKFGVEIDIPILADIKVGRWWGDARELTREEVFSASF